MSRPRRTPRKLAGRSSTTAALVLATAAPVVVAQVPAEDVCPPRVQLPPEPPATVDKYNGLALPEICLIKEGPWSVYAIGDWGGLTYGPRLPPVPADKRSKLFPTFHRKFVGGVDDRAQVLVASQIRQRAKSEPPDYFLNVGDNFYWGGVSGNDCNAAPFQPNASSQWETIFEQVYWGPGIDGKPWFGVLGNHDYGGYQFKAAWPNNLGYSWGGGGSTGRWVTPALYYSQKVNYPGFSILYLFMDTNVFEAWTPDMNPTHNICGEEHNSAEATCMATGGPESIWSCRSWFYKMWYAQVQWMEFLLAHNEATYQIVVTHFPPHYGQFEWKCWADKYGIDMFITGHIHKQRVFGPHDSDNEITGSCVIITGGGGGITSEDTPRVDGHDDSYGFVHLKLSKEYILADAISHGGIMRNRAECPPRHPNLRQACSRRLRGDEEFMANGTTFV